MLDIAQQLSKLDEQSAKYEIERALILKKALSGNDINAIYKAQTYLQKINNQSSSKLKEEQKEKSFLIDPVSPSTGMGYFERYHNLSFPVLRNMSRVWLLKAIIGTRVEQVVDFTRPQENKYATGFVIKPKKKSYASGKEEKVTKQQEKDIDKWTEFVLNCGDPKREWHGDSFESLIRKFLPDCLALDQGTFEVIRSFKDSVHEIIATDGGTYRIATQWDEQYRNLKPQDIPQYVQIYQSRVMAEFKKQELCFAVRNPQTSINSYGYGRSELEDMMLTITSILNTDTYNANYFKVGSNPKGLLRVSGNFNPARLEEFKQRWQSQVAGVDNSHKLPVIEADKMDFINTQASNKDMEYAKYYEFLIKIGCAQYKIDPSEIGFPLSGSENSAPMFEGSNEQRLKHSKDKGLKPLVKFVEEKINKYFLGPACNDEYVLHFVGLEDATETEVVESNIKKVTNYVTLNEIRRQEGLEDIEGGDIVLNPVFLQAMQMAQMGGEESNQVVEEQEEEENPFLASMNLESTFNDE